jgi:hypothetical protein
LACLGLSPQTGGHSSPLPCGLLPARAWASSTYSPRPTTHRATAWWSACTGSSRMPYVHVVRALRGTPISHGCCWAYVPPKEDSAVSSVAGHWDTTGSSWTAPAHARSSTCRRSAASNEAAVLCGGGQLSAGSLSQGGAHVLEDGPPAEATGGPICRPLPGGLQGSQDLHHPGGPVAGDRVSGQAWIQSLPLRPLLGADLPRCRPLLLSSLHLHEVADWGGGAHVEDRI